MFCCFKTEDEDQQSDEERIGILRASRPIRRNNSAPMQLSSLQQRNEAIVMESEVQVHRGEIPKPGPLVRLQQRYEAVMMEPEEQVQRGEIPEPGPFVRDQQRNDTITGMRKAQLQRRAIPEPWPLVRVKYGEYRDRTGRGAYSGARMSINQRQQHPIIGTKFPLRIIPRCTPELDETVEMERPLRTIPRSVPYPEFPMISQEQLDCRKKFRRDMYELRVKAIQEKKMAQIIELQKRYARLDRENERRVEKRKELRRQEKERKQQEGACSGIINKICGCCKFK